MMPLHIMQPLYPCENVLKGKYHLSIKFWLRRPPYTSSTQGTTLKSRVKKTNYTIVNLITTARSTMTKHSNWRPSVTVEGIRKASLRSDVLRPFPGTGILTLVLYLLYMNLSGFCAFKFFHPYSTHPVSCSQIKFPVTFHQIKVVPYLLGNKQIRPEFESMALNSLVCLQRSCSTSLSFNFLLGKKGFYLSGPH